MPETGAAKAVMLSKLVEQLRQLTISGAIKAGGEPTDAGRKGGHWDGAAPPSDTDGSHGQLSWGEKEIVTVQTCWGAKEKDEPGDVAQLSCSVKCGIPSKSLGVLPPPGKVNWRLRVAPEGSVFAIENFWEVGADPRSCAGKARVAGLKDIGWEHAVVAPNPRHMFPTSP